jgi:hypothetical protein
VPLIDSVVTSPVGLVTSAARPGSVIGRALRDVAERLELNDLLSLSAVLTAASRALARVAE